MDGRIVPQRQRTRHDGFGVRKAVAMSEDQQHGDSALRAANLALSGRQRREASRFASIELRFTDPRTGPWEMAAMMSIAVASMLVVIGLWFL